MSARNMLHESYHLIRHGFTGFTPEEVTSAILDAYARELADKIQSDDRFDPLYSAWIVDMIRSEGEEVRGQ